MIFDLQSLKGADILANLLTGFKRADSEASRVLLLDILLNGHSLDEIEMIEEVNEHTPFAGMDMQIRRVYGLTREAIDVRAIYQERSSIVIPVICSLQTFEMQTVSDVVYCHKPKGSENPLKIHDLGVISSHMVITSDTVISSKKARGLDECEYGFASFMEYVLKGSFELENWRVEYDDEDKTFEIYYRSTKGNNSTLVFQSVEYNKDATFSLVLYLIKKVYAEMVARNVEFTPDWFTVERWIREKGR